MFRKALLMPAVILGMIFGLITNDFFRHPGAGGQALWPDYLAVAGTVLAVYCLLTLFVFRVSRPTFGLSPAQFRCLWLGAFVLAAIGTPLIHDFTT